MGIDLYSTALIDNLEVAALRVISALVNAAIWILLTALEVSLLARLTEDTPHWFNGFHFGRGIAQEQSNDCLCLHL